ncbi:hypothetical protein ACOZE3_11620 [Streptomyces cinereoruber]|uniref:hypothetical protein n=1 Tax=Streptomyces cinereoruber TaxID=67260 RepID=UPI003BF52D03
MPREPFVTPDPRAFAESLGVEPVETGEGVLELDLTEVTGEPLFFGFSPLGGSVRLRWGRVDLHREGATLLRIVESPGGTGLSVDFATGTTTGTLRVEVFPRVAVRDELLLS